MNRILLLSSSALLIICITSCRKKPEAAFSISNDYPAMGEVVTFTDASQNAAYNSYHWDFGDGGSSQSTNPTHVYEMPGVYKATLEIADKKGKHLSEASEFVYVDAFKLGLVGIWRYDSASTYIDNCTWGSTNTTDYYESSTWTFNNDLTMTTIADDETSYTCSYDLTENEFQMILNNGYVFLYQYTTDGQNLHLNFRSDEPCQDTSYSYIRIVDLYFTRIE